MEIQTHIDQAILQIEASILQLEGIYIGYSQDQAKAVIDQFGDRIKKYIFKVED